MKTISTCSAMKRALFTLLLLAATVTQAEQILVYSGAGLRPAVQEIALLYEKRAGVKVTVDYGGSGQLLTRFRASGKGDVFIPGSKIYFEKLGKDVHPSRDIVAHTPVIGVAKASANIVKSFADLAKPGVRVGLGDSKAMALGRTAEKILKASAYGDKIRANVVMRAGTVKQLALYVAQGDVDAAIIGRSDAVQNAKKITLVDIPNELFQPEIVAVGVLATSTKPKLAEGFADLLVSEEGVAIFERFGFLPAPSAAQ